MAALNILFDKRKIALARARFRAWWEGESFDEEAVRAQIEETLRPANENETGDADDELFEFEPPSRLIALGALWGEGRVRPGDAAAEAAMLAPLGLGGEGVLAVLGAGHIAPLQALAEAHPGRIEAFEWREETLEAMRHGLKKAKLADRVSLTRIDLESYSFAAGAYDALVSIDDFAYSSFPPHLAQQILKCLKPGAAAAIECYVGFKAAELATAFASSFAEPQIQAHGDLLQFLVAAGLAVESDDDLTEPFMGYARQGFKQLAGRLSENQLDVIAARELAWEAEAWRMRLKLLGQRRLERRRIVLRRPSEEAAPAPGDADSAAAPEDRAKRVREDHSMEVAARIIAEHEAKKK